MQKIPKNKPVELESKHVPMLYSTEMVKALMMRRKTETRRTTGLDKINKNPNKWHPDVFSTYGTAGFYKFIERYKNGRFKRDLAIKCPYGKPGDIIWVRESFKHECGKYQYKADFIYPSVYKWKPSIHMPKAAARILLKIKEIKVERLHDIDEESALNEGIERSWHPETNQMSFTDYIYLHIPCNTALDSFKSLWFKINGKPSWKKNPWVWVVKFQKIDNPSINNRF